MLDIFKIVVFIMSVVIHEVSHGVMANSLGDSTAKDLGRITLNPFKHLDVFGSVILPVMLLLSNVGFVFGYAKPVPYNPMNLNDRKYGPAKVAFAGPASNILLAVVFGILLRFMPDVFTSPLIPQLFLYIVWINLALAIFNLFPIPPLDGHWLLMAILPDKLEAVKVFLYRYSIVLFLILLFFIGPILSAVVFSLMTLLTGIKL